MRNKMEKFKFQMVEKNWISSVMLTVVVITIIGNSYVTTQEPPAFFLKIAKSIPRMGRSGQYEDVLANNANGENNDLWYKDANPANEIIKRKVEFSPEEDTRTWQHFPLAIEGPPELWRTLAGYSQDPLYSSTIDFNNGLWTRDKRANSP